MLRKYLSSLPTQALSLIRATFAEPDPKRYARTAPKNWHSAKAAAPVAVDNSIKYTPDGVPYREVKPNEPTVNTEWHLMNGPTGNAAGRAPHLTPADLGEIKRLGFRESTAATVKGHWAAGRSATATALTTGASESTVQKMFAAFGRALAPPPPDQ